MSNQFSLHSNTQCKKTHSIIEFNQCFDGYYYLPAINFNRSILQDFLSIVQHYPLNSTSSLLYVDTILLSTLSCLNNCPFHTASCLIFIKPGLAVNCILHTIYHICIPTVEINCHSVSCYTSYCLPSTCTLVYLLTINTKAYFTCECNQGYHFNIQLPFATNCPFRLGVVMLCSIVVV